MRAVTLVEATKTRRLVGSNAPWSNKVAAESGISITPRRFSDIATSWSGDRFFICVTCDSIHCAMNKAAIIYALASAALFGVSTPAAKALLGSIHPAVLAGPLYFGAGVRVSVL